MDEVAFSTDGDPIYGSVNFLMDLEGIFFLNLLTYILLLKNTVIHQQIRFFRITRNKKLVGLFSKDILALRRTNWRG